jgi:glycosyltransferase involved in cell wall biosynthesis
MSPGGAAHSVLGFARALQNRGHVIEIICAKASNEYIFENADLKFNVLNIPISSSIYYWALFPFWQFRINQAFKKYKMYILFPQVFPSNWWTWIYKIFNRNQNIVWYCHEPSAFIHSRSWIKAIPGIHMRIAAFLLNPILKYSDIWLEKQNNIVICNSQFTLNSYLLTYQRKAQAYVFPPINFNIYALNLVKEDFLFTIGRLTKFKKVDTLIRAFKSISENYPTYKLIIAGEGEDKNRLMKLTNELGMHDKIIFLGKVDDHALVQLYSKAKVTINTSEHEPFGLVPVESMNFGTPVIAHNSGGPQETILHCITGLLYNSYEELIDSIKLILSLDDDKYLEMQQNCVDHARKFDISLSVEKLEKTLEDARKN